MKATEPKAKSAQMKATQPRAKRTAHLKAAHMKRTAQLRARGNSSQRFAHLRRPGMQARNLGLEPRLTQAQNSNSDKVKAAQEKLRQAGLYNGPSDGMMDPDTRAALAKFQQQNGLRRTETLDQQTLARLNSGQQTTGFGSSQPTGGQAPAPSSAGGNATGQQPTTR